VVQDPEITNVLYLCSSGMTGGAEISLCHLVRGIDRNRYIPFVLCPEPGSLVEKLAAEQIFTRVVNLPAWRKLKSLPSRFTALRHLTSFVQENHIQLIHSNTIWVNPYAQKAGEKLRIPVICHLRDLIRRDQVKKYALDKVDMIIAISNAVRRPLEEAGVESAKIRKIYNGVNVSMFDHGKDVLRENFAIHGFLVGIVGQLNPRSQWKGQRDFIQAAAKMIQHRSDVHFAVIGGDDSPASAPGYMSYIRELKELAEDLGIADRVIFTGFRTDIPDVMASLDILVSASWAEPFGRVIIEAMAAGKPVIATMAGGAPEIVQDGVTGMLVPPRDPQAIASAALHMLRDNGVRQKMGRAGQKRVQEYFSLDRNVRETQAIYEALRKAEPSVLSCLPDHRVRSPGSEEERPPAG
jgi:glycosyltransferase involved in cell wall biosynthesis